jgi:hypothetical protein
MDKANRELERAKRAHKQTTIKWKEVRRLIEQNKLQSAQVLMGSVTQCGHCKEYGLCTLGRFGRLCPLIDNGNYCCDWPLWRQVKKFPDSKKLVLRLVDLVLKRSAAAVEKAKSKVEGGSQ